MRTPTSEHAKRLALMMHRRLSTPWDRCEIKKIRELEKAGHFKSLENLGLMERYYRMNWPPRHGKNALRTNLITILNNYAGEVDRAVVWDEQHPIERKIIQLPPVKGNIPEETADPEQLARFQDQREQRSAFRKAKEAMGK